MAPSGLRQEKQAAPAKPALEHRPTVGLESEIE